MSKADELGAGRFANTQGVSARRAAVAAATGAATVGAPDSRLRTIPLEQLVPTRFNPRRNFGGKKELLEFGLKVKKKQLAPAVAVTRDAYLMLWEEEADSVGTARYVIANGERRFRGSKEAGSGTLEVIVDDSIAESRATFLDAVLSENNDREDLDPIERALGIQTMVEQLGGNAEVAKHYEKSGGWVTQQMYLLNLAPELQALVSSGDLPVRETRTLVKLPPDRQLSTWQNRVLEREKEKERPRTRRPSPTNQKPSTPQLADGFTAVKPLTEPDTHADNGQQVGSAAPKVREGNPSQHPSSSGSVTEERQDEGEATLPEPRRSHFDDSATTVEQTPESSVDVGDDRAGATWQLPPGGWEPTFNAVVAQMGEFDRHMLTGALNKLRDQELGSESSQNTST
ncbi:ParB/RepB/Spo0J family partition protein [Streptomyces sp. ITFR-6]|uniref:ParB/RepB/Spo0J family partition protein n=1 Tax=Streptomyces sp. ITFR-6 TaxID=3075197 RepID=UPI00288BF658|nr:ParB/RepB/Spo0J family partition protein [Streptomyces sp. ITFR-6]WNI34389.1 ParB/RepB/Spo0J family partition protein [Streptomyces sp. ITFR-6]